MVKLSRKDKELLFKLSVDNRNFLITLANLNITMTFSMTAFIISVLSILLVLNVFNEYKQYLSISFFIIILIVWYIGTKQWRKNFKGAMDLQKQYEKELKELYPNLGKYYH